MVHPDSKDPWIDVDYISIRRESVGSILIDIDPRVFAIWTAQPFLYFYGAYLTRTIQFMHFADHSDGLLSSHDDVIQWKHFPCHWPFVRGIDRSPANSPHKGKSRGALMFSLICASVKASVNNLEAGDLRRHRSNYDVSVMQVFSLILDDSVSLSAGIQSDGDSDPETLGSNPAFNGGRHLVTSLLPVHQN